MDIEFLKCKTCIVQANCGSLCDEYRDYVLEKTGVELHSSSTFNRKFIEKLLRASSNIKIYGQEEITMDIDMEKFENDKL